MAFISKNILDITCEMRHNSFESLNETFIAFNKIYQDNLLIKINELGYDKIEIDNFNIINRRFYINILNVYVETTKVKYGRNRKKEDVLNIYVDYIICAELQFMNNKYYYVTYPVKFNGIKYIRPNLKHWQIFDNVDDLMKCLFNGTYYKNDLINFK